MEPILSNGHSTFELQPTKGTFRMEGPQYRDHTRARGPPHNLC